MDTRGILFAIHALLGYVWRDIDYDYDGLTDAEKQVFTREQFEALAEWALCEFTVPVELGAVLEFYECWMEQLPAVRAEVGGQLASAAAKYAKQCREDYALYCHHGAPGREAAATEKEAVSYTHLRAHET